MAIPAPTYTVGFSSNEERTTGSMRVTDTTNWASYGIDPADVEIGYGYVAPDGNAYKVAAQGVAGNIFPDVQDWSEFPLPNAVDGTVQQGDYVVTTIYYVGGAVDPGTYEPTPTTHNLCTDYPVADLQTNPDCLRLVVSATDATQWASLGWTVNSREMTLQYPSSTYHADITGAGPTVSTSGEPIWSGKWTATVTVEITKNSYTVEITTVKQFSVACDLDGCTLFCLMKGIYSDYKEAYAAGDNKETGKALMRLEKLSFLSNMIQYSIQCGDETYLNSLMGDFRETATGKRDSGDCSCCDECGEPRQLVPIWQSGSGSMWTPLAGTNMTVTAGVNTYTFSVSQAFIDLVNSHYNTVVDSPLGTITVTSTVAGSTTTYHVEAAKVMPDYMEFLWSITDTTGPVEALGTPTVVGTTFKIPGTITQSGNLYIFSNLMLGAAAAFNVDAEIVDPILRAPYSTTHRDHPMVRAEIISNSSTTQFTLGIVADDDVFITDNGKAHLAPWYDRHLASFKVLFKLTRRTV